MARYTYNSSLVSETIDKLTSAVSSLDNTNTDVQSGVNIIVNARGAENINFEDSFTQIKQAREGVIDNIDTITTDIRNKAQKIEEYQSAPVWKKLFATLGMVILKRAEGFLNAHEFLGDIVITVAGYVCGIFNTEFSNGLKEYLLTFAEKDLVSDFFSDQYENGKLAWIDKYSMLSPDSTACSILKGFGAAGQNIVLGLYTGISDYKDNNKSSDGTFDALSDIFEEGMVSISGYDGTSSNESSGSAKSSASKASTSNGTNTSYRISTPADIQFTSTESGNAATDSAKTETATSTDSQTTPTDSGSGQTATNIATGNNSSANTGTTTEDTTNYQETIDDSIYDVNIPSFSDTIYDSIDTDYSETITPGEIETDIVGVIPSLDSSPSASSGNHSTLETLSGTSSSNIGKISGSYGSGSYGGSSYGNSSGITSASTSTSLSPAIDKIGKSTTSSLSSLVSKISPTIPTSEDPITTTTDKTSTKSSMIPLGAGLGAASIAGIGTKTYLDKRNNKNTSSVKDDEDEKENTDNLEIDYEVPRLTNEPADYLTPDDEYAYQKNY